jgi:hypothetical protein
VYTELLNEPKDLRDSAAKRQATKPANTKPAAHEEFCEQKRRRGIPQVARLKGEKSRYSYHRNKQPSDTVAG